MSKSAAKLARRNTNWTKEEDKYLIDNWGFKSRKVIAKNLQRTELGVYKRALKLNMLASQLADELTVSQLAEILNIYPTTIMQTWIPNHNFPYYMGYMFGKRKVRFVKMDLFWDWVKSHMFLIDLSNLEPNTLGPEPSWVKHLRRAQHYNRLRLSKNNCEWTTDDDKLLKDMLSKYAYTYQEISEKLSRSNNSIKRRIKDLGLLARPLSMTNKLWTDENIEVAIKLRRLGYEYEIIGDKLNKTAMAVRAKLERLVDENKISQEELNTFEEDYIDDEHIKSLIFTIR